jgi:hypothetical protein
MRKATLVRFATLLAAVGGALVSGRADGWLWP